MHVDELLLVCIVAGVHELLKRGAHQVSEESGNYCKQCVAYLLDAKERSPEAVQVSHKQEFSASRLKMMYHFLGISRMLFSSTVCESWYVIRDLPFCDRCCTGNEELACGTLSALEASASVGRV